jgi:ketosteroid isomerase-like protein
MKKLVTVLVTVCAFAGFAFAQAPTTAAATPAKSPSVSQIVKQLEHDWVDAAKAGDADKLGQILADDWVSINPDGSKQTKQSDLADVKSGASKIESFEFGPMEVKVLGNIAVVQGSDTEKSTSKGKDSSGKYVWMDVFAKIGGKWQAVRSQNAMVK